MTLPLSPAAAYPARSCNECELQAAGRCPTCRRALCMDHFPLEEHQPCAARLVEEAARRICYVCGTPVVPQQWSTAVFAHYIDSQKCAGCGRYVCAERHTKRRDEVVQLARDGLRSNRYHMTVRYCDICAPVRRFGGLVGVTWWVVGLALAGAAAFFLFVR
jgi:hypothetical protein